MDERFIFSEQCLHLQISLQFYNMKLRRTPLHIILQTKLRQDAIKWVSGETLRTVRTHHCNTSPWPRYLSYIVYWNNVVGVISYVRNFTNQIVDLSFIITEMWRLDSRLCKQNTLDCNAGVTVFNNTTINATLVRDNHKIPFSWKKPSKCDDVILLSADFPCISAHPCKSSTKDFIMSK